MRSMQENPDRGLNATTLNMSDRNRQTTGRYQALTGEDVMRKAE